MSNTISIKYSVWMIDFPSLRETTIDLDEILGVKLHLRVHGWRVEVVSRELKQNTHEYKSIELDGVVGVCEIKKLISNEKCIILGITNHLGYNSFQEHVLEILS